HPLIVHIGDWQLMGEWAQEIPDYAIDLARAFWPGPMTLVLKRSNLAKDFITGGQETVGIRVPNQTLALQLLKEFSKIGGKGIAAPSANRFGQVSPTTAEAVRQELGAFLSESDAILDGGPCAVGLESTIIDCTGTNPKILRPGAITVEDIKGVTGLEVDSPERSEIRVSGSLENHYAPDAQVLLDIFPQPGDGFIALAEIPTPDGVIRLSAPKSLEAFAHDLYAALREGDAKEIQKIVVLSPQGGGIAIAIRDRLKRAAASK
ncbi:MAG: L-threonylcarbamoyladenylate synthase, partial [Actinobacteria bacterium]|nr:L-threonylcarbamoyladenylate synthase [Actinomycetota bacterium]